MRVIAGTAKGRPLASVPGESTRPITDRVKAALFSILTSADMIEGRRYLDLFGGTGAVGIEALSRGAAEVVFCEKDRAALRVLRQNLETTGTSARGMVVPGDAFNYLVRPDLQPFDVIYIAPPQYEGLWLRALQVVDGRPALLRPDGLAIIQIFPKEWTDPVLSHLAPVDRRQYGSTALHFFGPATESSHPEQPAGTKQSFPSTSESPRE